MRILMVNTHASQGGAARVAATLARALDASGCSVRLIHCGDRSRRPPLYGIQRPLSRPLNAALARCGGSLAVHDLGVSDEIARQAETADVIHLHNLHGYYLDWDRLLRSIGQRPLLWTWHDVWGATGRCGVSLGCDGWRTGCSPCPHLDYYPAAWFDRGAREYGRKSYWLDHLPRLVIATPSEWLREIAVQRGVAAERVVVVPNPVDVATYRPTPKLQARQELGLPPEGPYLLFAASHGDDPVKGYPDFLEVARQTGWSALVAGGRPRDLPSHVRYLGNFREPAALSVCYSAADALLAPSRFDNSPNTVVESMACGTPVFAFGAGGIPSQMHPRWGGVVAVGDQSALAGLVRAQLGSEGKTEAMVAELRDYAVSRWGSENVSKRYLGTVARRRRFRKSRRGADSATFASSPTSRRRPCRSP